MRKSLSQRGNVVTNPALRVINYILLGFAVVLIVSPILIVLNISFKTNEEYMYSSVFQLPENILNFSNYLTVLIKGNLLLGYKNTLIMVLISTLGSVIMGTMVAYSLGRFNFKINKLLLGAFFVSSVIPQITTQVATFSIIKNLHLYNTIFSAILLYVSTNVLHIYIFLQFVQKIPYELDESALIDGASFFRIYRSIIMPQMKPAIITVVILKTLDIYNDMFIPFLYMPKSSLKTVSTALLKYSYDQNSQWNIMAAGIVAVMLPTLLMYLYLQKHIMAGVTDGAVKG